MNYERAYNRLVQRLHGRMNNNKKNVEVHPDPIYRQQALCRFEAYRLAVSDAVCILADEAEQEEKEKNG
jgi:hypothetical protein